MRAVTPNFTFVMKRPEKGWGLDNDKINSTIKKENNALKKEMWKGIDDGTITPERASAVHYHILWKRVSRKLKWEYSKSKTR